MKPRTRSTGIIALVILIVTLGLGIYLKKTANLASQQRAGIAPSTASLPQPTTTTFATYSEEDWKRALTPEQYHVLRQAGTDIPFTHPLVNEHRPGTYVTADCNEPVFRSEQKFDSGTGWPSFWAPIKPDAVVEKTDTSLFAERTEILSRCGGHLGHVFDDGPQPTGLRYCMNGTALKFIPDTATSTAS